MYLMYLDKGADRTDTTVSVASNSTSARVTLAVRMQIHFGIAGTRLANCRAPIKDPVSTQFGILKHDSCIQPALPALISNHHPTEAHHHWIAMAESLFTIPTTFQSVDRYFDARKELINAERNLGYEGRAKRSPLETAAEKIVQDLKSWEEHNHHGILGDGTGHEAGHRFMHGFDSVEKSKLLEISLKAPKGCLLHCHFDAMLPPDTLLSDARKQPRLYIKTDAPLTSPGFFAYALPQFDVFAEEIAPTEATNLFSRNYVTGSWMKYSEFLKQFPGNAEKAEEWLRKRMVLQVEDTYHPQQTVNG